MRKFPDCYRSVVGLFAVSVVASAIIAFSIPPVYQESLNGEVKSVFWKDGEYDFAYPDMETVIFSHTFWEQLFNKNGECHRQVTFFRSTRVWLELYCEGDELIVHSGDVNNLPEDAQELLDKGRGFAIIHWPQLAIVRIAGPASKI